MANKNILTYNAKVTELQQAYYAPVAILPTTGQVIDTLYCFLARVEPWTDEASPNQPTQDLAYLKSVHKSIFVVKKIKSNDISPVTQRIDWATGIVYDYFRDDIDMFEVDQNGLLVKSFYVRNRYDQVFKCLWNNNGAASTQEPYFQPGTYGTNNIYQGSDNYKWKYIYTIDIGSKTKFMDSTWIPVPVKTLSLNPTLTSAGAGSIDAINVISGGSGYDTSNSITISITGDGTGANAIPVVVGGAITDVIVNNPGSNYSYANVTVVAATTPTSNASVVGPTSPIGGHGFDPVSELGCNHIMFTAQFNGSEGGLIPTDNNFDYRQIGLLSNPVASDTSPFTANADIYKTSTDLVVAGGSGTYIQDEIIYNGSINLSDATFTATVLSFDTASNTLKLINTKGVPKLNSPVFGNSSQTVRTLFSVDYPKFITYSGYVIYIENRESVQRSYDGIEQFKFVLGY